jgi:aryl-alcohol dehydrogenase-like predicted oxidoreductase
MVCVLMKSRVDPGTPIEETIEALLELKAEGKIKYIGLSECSADTLRRASAITQISAYQVEYSPVFTDIENQDIGVLDAARELGIAIVPYSPLGRGLLTGKYKSPNDFEEGDFRRSVPRFSEENFPKILNIVDELDVLAKKKGCTPGQLTLAWILNQGDDFVPLFGTTRIANIEENLGALEVQLTKEEAAEIRKLVDAAADTTGERYPAAYFTTKPFYSLPPMMLTSRIRMSAELFGESAPKK